MERTESELSPWPREDAVLLGVTEESNARGLKVIKEGGRQMVPLKMRSAGRGSRTSPTVDPKCWGQGEPSLGRKGQKGTSPRGRCSERLKRCWRMWPGQEITITSILGWGWRPEAAEKGAGNKM